MQHITLAWAAVANLIAKKWGGGVAKKKHVSVEAEASVLHIAESLALTCRATQFLDLRIGDLASD
jgi:hypothetical protein